MRTAKFILHTLVGFSTVFYTLAVGLLAVPSAANAQSVGYPTSLGFQGRLKTLAGAAISSGTYDFRFRLFDTGDAAATSDYIYVNDISVVNGFFSLAIPLGTDIGDTRFDLDLEVGTVLSVGVGAGVGGTYETFASRVTIYKAPYSVFTQAIQNSAADPGNPFAGELYYDTDEDEVKFYDSTAGAFVTLSSSLDDAYNNSGASPIINVDKANGLEFESTVAGNIIVDLQNTGDFVVQDAGVTYATFSDSGAITLAASVASSFSTAAGDLSFTATTGSVNVAAGEAAADAIRLNASAGAGGIDVDAGTGGIAIDTTGSLSLDAANASNITTTGGGLVLHANGEATSIQIRGGDTAPDADEDGNDVAIEAEDDFLVETSGSTDFDVAGVFNVDSTGAISLDAAASSNFSVSAGTLSFVNTAGDVLVTGNAAAGSDLLADFYDPATNATGRVQLDASEVEINSFGADGVDINVGDGGPFTVDTAGSTISLTAGGGGSLSLTSSQGNATIDTQTGAHSISIGTSNVARTINIGTSTGDDIVNFGNSLGGNDAWNFTTSETTNNAFDISGTSLTTADLFNIVYTGTTGSAFDITDSSGDNANSMMKLDNSDGTVSAQTYLIDASYSAENAEVNADFLRFSDNGGAKFTVSENGLTVIAGLGDGTAALTLTTGDLTVTDGNVNISAGDFDAAIDSGDTASFTGAANTTANILNVSGTNNASNGQNIALTLGNDGDADTVAGLNVAMTSANTGDADSLVGVNIANLGGADGAVTETALKIGTGWDVGLSLGSALNMLDAVPIIWGTDLDVSAAWDDAAQALEFTNGLVTIGDDAGGSTATGAGELFVAGDFEVDGVIDVNGGTLLDVNDLLFVGAGTLATGAGSTLNINSGTTGTVNVGTDASNESINVGTGAAVKALTLGSTNTTSSTVLQSGTGDLALTSSDDFSITATDTVSIDGAEFDVSSLTGSITIDDGGNAGAILVEGTNLDINDLTFVGAGTIQSADGLNLSLITTGAGDLGLASGDAVSISADGAITLNSQASSSFAVAVGDLSLSATLASVNITGNEDAADAVAISSTAGGIDILATGEAGQDIDIVNTGGSVNVQGTEAAANAVRIIASNPGAGGIDMDSGLGGFDLTTTGAIAMTAGQASSFTTSDDQLTIATGTAATVFSGSAEGASAVVVTAGDVVLTDGDLTLVGGDFDMTGNTFTVNATEFDINGGTGAITINDGGDAGSLTVEGTLLNQTSLQFFSSGAILSAAGTNMTLDSGTTGGVYIGTGDNAKTISIGTGTAGNVINVGTDNTVLDTISIGSALDNVAITGDDWSISDAGAVSIASLAVSGLTDLNGNLQVADTDIAFDGASTTFTTTGAFTLTPGGAMLFGDGGDSFAVDTTEFDINAGTGGITINDGGDAGFLNIETTIFDVDSINFAGAGTVSSLAGSNLAFTSGTTGSVTVDSGTTGNVSLGTGASAKILTIGNVTGTTAVNVQTGTGGMLVTTTGTGDFVLNSGDTVLLDAVGALELNSSAGAINIGNDAVAQAINIGTGAAARTTTIGNSTGATALTVNSGSGGATINSTGNITLDTTAAGSVNIIGSEAVADAVRIIADGALGGIDIDAGSAGVTIDTSGALSIDVAAASNFTTSDGALTLTGAGTSTWSVDNGDLSLVSSDLDNDGSDDLVFGAGDTRPNAGENGDDVAVEAEDDFLVATSDDITFNPGDDMIVDGVDRFEVSQLSASGHFLVDAESSAHTATGGAFDLNFQGGNVSGVSAMDIDVATFATAIDAGNDIYALDIGLTADDADADYFGIRIVGADDDGVAGSYEAAVSIDNADSTAASMTDAVKISSSGVDGGVVDAVDASDPNIMNALNIGTNNIVGTTGTINLDNFDVDAAGAVTTAGGLSVSGGTTSFSGSVVSGASPFVFEGATADAFETTFAMTDATADRTVTFQDGSGTVAYLTDIVSQWETGASGTYEDDAAVIIGADGAFSSASGGVGDLRIASELEVDGASFLEGALTVGGLADFNGNVSIADTNIALDGASTTLTATGDLTLTSPSAASTAITLSPSNAAGGIFADGGTTDRTGDLLSLDVDVNSASVDGISIDLDIGTALSNGEAANGLNIDIAKDAGNADNAGSTMNGIFINSAGDGPSVISGIRFDGGYDNAIDFKDIDTTRAIRLGDSKSIAFDTGLTNSISYATGTGSVEFRGDQLSVGAYSGTTATSDGDLFVSSDLEVDSILDVDGSVDFDGSTFDVDGSGLVSATSTADSITLTVSDAGNAGNDNFIVSVGNAAPASSANGDDIEFDAEGNFMVQAGGGMSMFMGGNSQINVNAGDLYLNAFNVDGQNVYMTAGNDAPGILGDGNDIELRAEDDVILNATGTVSIANDIAVTDDFSVEGITDMGTMEALADDTTPDVSGSTMFSMPAVTGNVTDFDSAVEGQIIIIDHTGAATFECSDAAELICGTTDMVTAAGDTTTWFYDGADWELISWMDHSDAQTGADLAEWFPATEDLEAADVVTASFTDPVHVAKSSASYEKGLLGVVATQPGLILGERGNSQFAAKIALAGRVPVKFSSENGEVETGDYLTSSATFPGYAMKATQAGPVIGMAMESSNGAEQVIVKVDSMWYAPSNDQLQGGNAADLIVAESIEAVDGIFSGSVTVAEHLYGSRDMAGRVRLNAGDSSVRVTFENAYEFLPVVTFSLRSDEVVPGHVWVSDEDTAGFTINHSAGSTTAFDLEFNWIAIGVEEAIVTVSNGSEEVFNVNVEEPVAEEPVAEEPVAEEPAAEEVVAEEPVAEEPVVEEPAPEVEAPAEDAPVEQPAE